jgi:hypothetical protein
MGRLSIGDFFVAGFFYWVDRRVCGVYYMGMENNKFAQALKDLGYTQESEGLFYIEHGLYNSYIEVHVHYRFGYRVVVGEYPRLVAYEGDSAEVALAVAEYQALEVVND